MSTPHRIEDLLRELAPQVLAALLRRHGGFEECEDAVQEALLAAATQWLDAIPDSPRSWLITVATRRLLDHIRSEQARRRREAGVAVRDIPDAALTSAPGYDTPGDHDDTLVLLFLCCHPALTPASQVGLTLRAVGGLTTAEVARAFLVPEATMAPRISRAKQRLKAVGASFAVPTAQEWPERLAAVLHVLYLIFNEGYTASSGPELHRRELTTEAIRLTRMLHHLAPEDGETAGLLALMLLTDARRAARTGPGGALIPLSEQDRGLWNTAAIDEGTALVTQAMARSSLGPYQLQAAIAALHVQPSRAEDTDWEQIRILYDILRRVAPNPMVMLNHAIAIAMTRGPQAGLDLLENLDNDPRIAGHHRLYAVRAHLQELAGNHVAAHDNYRLAARRTISLPEQRYLRDKAEALHRQIPGLVPAPPARPTRM
ncbi:RNA polymerase sigma factor [Nocardia brevicatena]|uniref:RNA polymerase sigma factor n=1 Tax=Nocardia brevicatena TaxID=37327 RepID=UPI0002E80A2A|nr:sigma-70 family RNA polymerase sigma factor [Nocardia brevicatena]